MPFSGSWKKLQVCRSSAMAIEVIGFVKVGSGSEVVEAIVGGPKTWRIRRVEGSSSK